MSDDGYVPTLLPAITAKTKSATVSCSGFNIKILGHEFDPNIASYLPLLEPLRGKNKRILKRQPVVPKKPTNWWKAQSVFRGIDVKKRSIIELQSQLRSTSNLPMVIELVDLERKMQQEYKEKNDQAYEKLQAKEAAEWETKWPTLTIDEQANADEVRFLNERFPADETTQPSITVRIFMYSTLERMTRQRGLAYSFLAFPTGHPDRAGYHTGLVIIGRNSSDFENNTRWKELKASIKRATKQEALAAAQEEERRKQMARQVLEMTGKGKEWDVRGKYSIKLPAIEKGWNVSDLTMEIFTEKRSGTSQMFAKFNFSILKGVMRFERQKDLTAKKDKKPDSSRKRKREPNSEDEDEYNRDRRSPTPDEFYLSPVTLPSKQHCTWTYRWRGEETGEGEIQARSEHNAYSITFLDPRSTKIKGTFGSEYFSDDEFTGVKIRPGRDSSIDISDEWAEGNEASYDRRCRGRWH